MSAKAIRKALAPLYRKTRIAHFAVRVFFFFLCTTSGNRFTDNLWQLLKIPRSENFVGFFLKVLHS